MGIKIGNTDISAIKIGSTQRLPSAYIEVEYIQSTGTQYINTGYIPTIYDTIETKFLTDTSSSDTNLYGSRDNSGYNFQDYTIWINTSSGKGIAVHYPYGSGASQTTDTGWFYTNNIITNPVILKVTPDYCYVNNEIKYTFNISRTDYTGTYQAYLFAQNQTGTASRIGKFKVYYFKIYNNGVLQRDLVPCYRESDGVIGMYDLVNDTFYTNSGTGTFTKGADVGYKNIQKVYLGSTLIRPDQKIYQEVEWIQGNANGCSIDTGVSVGSNTFKLETDIMGTTLSPNEQPVASIWTSAYGYWNFFLWNQSANTYMFDCYTQGHHTTASISANTKYNLVLERISSTSWSLSMDGTATTWTYTPGSVNNTTIKLFRRGDGNVPSNPSTIRMYNCKITVAGIVVRDMMPCYRVADGVIGMLDKINNVFYTNSGTGTFTKGPDVN